MSRQRVMALAAKLGATVHDPDCPLQFNIEAPPGKCWEPGCHEFCYPCDSYAYKSEAWAGALEDLREIRDSRAGGFYHCEDRRAMGGEGCEWCDGTEEFPRDISREVKP